ncbi:MAG: hypothetical protein ACFBSE_06200 [Prochloraceae cyanobacterium]
MKHQSKNSISQDFEIVNLLDNSDYWLELNSTEAEAISGGQVAATPPIPTAAEIANELVLGDLTDKSEQFIDNFDSGLFGNNPEALAAFQQLSPLS